MKERKFKSYSDLPLTLNALDVAEVLGISRAAAYELVRSRGFPHMNVGKRILIPKDAFLEWIREQSMSDNCVASLANHDADVKPCEILL